ncbi:class I SAM-dependent methyltransferase [Hymenobacter sp. B81]|uniref:class I SAM-dependent methyltransferase n=1 Tax=Hymenobacter sp. B81 TaxID=3344878 RepID=UPI0037DC97E7
MDVAYESKYHELEEQNWWFVSRRDMVFDLIQQLKLDRNAHILEVGCSGGPLMLALGKAGYTNLTGIDVSEAGIALARRRGLTRVSVMDGANLSFADESVDLLIASDVLEHIEDEGRALREWTRVLRPGGRIIVFVPAFQMLWSHHDVVNHHFRRYSAASLQTALRGAGLRVDRTSYWNAALFFPTALVRLSQRLLGKRQPDDTQGDLKPLPAPLNQALSTLIKTENRLLRRVNYPLGVSVFALAHKPR